MKRAVQRYWVSQLRRHSETVRREAELAAVALLMVREEGLAGDPRIQRLERSTNRLLSTARGALRTCDSLIAELQGGPDGAPPIAGERPGWVRW